MHAANQVIGTLSCPIADDEAIEQMLMMPPTAVLSELRLWVLSVIRLHPNLGMILDEPLDGADRFNGSFAHGVSRTVVQFRLLTTAQLEAAESDEDLGRLAECEADLLVLCAIASPNADGGRSRLARLVEMVAGPLPQCVVLEPAWLAAAVVQKRKPFVFPGQFEGEDGGELYFTGGNDDGESPRLSRASASTRRQLDEILLEPRSLTEKIRQLGSRLDTPTGDTILVTTFLPPVTHSRSALVRYYSREGDIRPVVKQLIDARQSAQWQSWVKQVESFSSTVIVDRQQIEEYFEEPEYYQMTLTPDELDEQVAVFQRMLSFENFRCVLCREAVDIPFYLTGDVVELRGDRRNRSEPRAGRVNGLTLADQHLSEELRREAHSLIHLTEAKFKNRDFISSWIEWLADRYRRTWARTR